MSKKCQDQVCQRKTSIGGQALIEGIMMRGPKMSAMAVRNPQGEMVLETFETKAVSKAKITRLPLIRGVFGFISSMKQGYRCLMRSAEIAGLEDAVNEMKAEKEAAKTAKKQIAEKEISDETDVTVDAPAADVDNSRGEEPTVSVGQETISVTETQEKQEKKKDSSTSVLMGAITVISLVLGVGLSVVLFIMLPTFIYKWCSMIMPFLAPSNPALKSLVTSVFEGVLKILILLVYMLLVSRMKDIHKTFQYHGAEHKTIFCYEHNKELTVENIRGERRFHPRCGTSFLILMLLVGIFVGFFIDPLFILLTGAPPITIVRALIRLLLLPLTMGIGYELIKLAGKFDNRLTRIISAPGMWLQHITVLEPTDDMIECAIAAFTKVIPEDESDRV